MQATKRVRQFSHSDMDGLGCIAMAKKMFAEVDYTVCDYADVNEKIKKFCQEYTSSNGVPHYDYILITDISVNEEVAEMLNHINKNFDAQVVLIDHHKTSLWLNEKYPWTVVIYELDHIDVGGMVKKKTSGTSLLFRTFWNYMAYMMDEKLLDESTIYELERFAEIVRLWDTFEWNETTPALDTSEPFKLQTLLSLKGKDWFLDRFGKNMSTELSPEEEADAKMEIDNILRYIKDVSRNAVLVDWNGYRVAVVYAEQHTSILGNRLHELLYDDSDFVIIINMVRRTYSLRTTRTDINLGEISKQYLGGGGHPQAAGAELTRDTYKKIVNTLYGSRLIETEVNN